MNEREMETHLPAIKHDCNFIISNALQVCLHKQQRLAVKINDKN